MPATNYEAQATARIFVESFPIGSSLNIDSFDMFIIDNGLATDPHTDDTTNPAYKGFIQERSQARGLLNRAAATLNGDAFQISIVTPGTEYAVITWSNNALSLSRDMGNKVNTYTHGRFNVLKTLHNKAEQLRLEDPTDPELQEAHAMLAIMRVKGLELTSQVKALVYQYNAGADATEKILRTLLENKSKGKDDHDPDPSTLEQN